MRHSSNRVAVCALALALAPIVAASARAPAGAFHSGIYGAVVDDLRIAVEPDGTIDGLFLSATGPGSDPANWTICRFLIHGRVANGVAALQAWTNGDGGATSTGTLSPADDGGVYIKLAPTDAFAGCDLSPYGNGAEASRIRATAWQGLRLVSAARAYLHAAPGDRKMPRRYVVRDDVVGVLPGARDAAGERWVLVDYVSERGAIASGWVRESELARISPP